MSSATSHSPRKRSTLGAILRTMRLKRNLTIKQAGYLYGGNWENEGYISRKENGVIKMPWEEFKTLAGKLGYAVDVLIIDRSDPALDHVRQLGGMRVK